VELKLNLAPGLPPIAADPAQIQQVVMNLVINAAESIGDNQAGEVSIRICLREMSATDAAEGEPAPGTYVEIEVRDTGSGMDETTQARIFDPFFTTKFMGRGLGLAAVQGIIKGHRGVIRVQSTPGRGTTFLILLPAAVQQTGISGPVATEVRSIPPDSVALVIDDEEIVRALADTALSNAGMKVFAAVNGRTGIEIFREQHARISLVILDLLMPTMGGEEALDALRKIDPDVPVVLSSGYNQREASIKFSDPKSAIFLQKPYTADQLVEAVAAALHRPKK
jgi:CheY-like chemotaxis protein